MKIAVVIHTFNNERGGKEIVTWNLVKQLLDRGITVELVVNEADDMDHPNLHYHRVPMRFKAFGYHRKDFASNAYNRLENIDYDVCYVNGKAGFGHVARYGGLPHRSYLEKRLRFRSGWSRVAEKIRQSINLNDIVSLKLEEQTLRSDSLERIVVASPLIQSELLEQYPFLSPEKIEVIYNGFDRENFPVEDRGNLRRSIRHEYELDQDQPVLLFVGNNFQLKGLPLVIDWLKDHRSYDLLVVGDDDPLSLGNNLESRVHWVGPVEDVSPYYAAADSLFLPSKAEGFGLVVLEALSMGCFVVTSPQVGASNLIDEPWMGAVVPREEFMDYEFPEGVLRNEQHISQRHESTADYTWECMADQYVEIFRSVKKILDR